MAADAEEMLDFNNPQFYFEEGEYNQITDILTPIEFLKRKIIHSKNNLSYFHINAQSIPKHYDEIVRLLIETGVDFLLVSETFICESTPKTFYKIPGYKFFHKDRTMQARGGVGIYVKDTLPCKEIKLCKDLIQPEMIFIEITCNTTKVAVGVIYKTPLVSYTQYSQITEVLAPIMTQYQHHIIMGDFNIDYLKPNSSECKFFKEHVTEPFDLSQLITEPTRIADSGGRTSKTLIDLLLVSYPDNVKVSGVVDVPGLADHCLIYGSYALKKPKFSPKVIIKRKMDNFNIENFKRDVDLAPWGNLLVFEENDLDNKVTVLENIYKEIIDRHCPKVEFRVTHPSSCAWRTDEIKQLQKKRDQFYTQFKKMKNEKNILTKNDPNFKRRLQITENVYHQLRNKVTHEIRKSKIKVFDEKINKKLKQPKDFYHALKTHDVVDSKTMSFSPINISPTILNQVFLSNNNAEIDEQKLLDETARINQKPQFAGTKFNFSEINGLDVKKVVKTIKTNACGVDDISSFFIKISIEHTADILADIINSSFKNKFFPSRWKQAIVKPIPKINNPLQPSDYRPISLLPAFSKIIEKISAKQMALFLKEHKLLDKLQSAYKNMHSTTTALLNVSDDIFKAIDESEVVLLTLLDYSKAFDTANHQLILAKLKHFGFHDDALSWISSYLSNRSQKVRTTTESNWESIKNGVPQGSILGPLLFTVLVSDISETITSGSYHTYADDLQFYMSFAPDQAVDAFNTANIVLSQIGNYSNNTFLKLNTDKSKYIVIGTKHNLSKVLDQHPPPLELNGDILEGKSNVKNLGVIFDENMFWINHINAMVTKAYGRLKQAYRSRNFLSEASRFKIIETYILSLFNYGDVLFFNITERLANKIQRVQNSCMRFVFGLRKYDHISSCFLKNKTLNMENRRKLHALTLMHKISTGLAPDYLSEKLTRHLDLHDYNTRGRENFAVPRVNTSTRSNTFLIAIAKLYNDFLSEINTNPQNSLSVNLFKKKCKTFLTCQQFPGV